MRDATHHFLPKEGSWQVSGRTGNGISESNYSVSEPRQQCLTGTLLCKIQDTGMSHLLGTTIHRSKGAQKGVNVQSWSGVTLTQLTGSPSDQPQTTCSPDASLEGHSRPWATAGELWEARFILENPSRHLPWTLSWKHCFSVTETRSSQHGPNSGCNGTDSCCQEWDQDMTGNLYQQGLHPKTTLAQAQWMTMRWEALPPVPAWPEPNERAHAGKQAQPTANCMWQGQAVGSRWPKTHFKAKWKQPLLLLWRFETTIGGLNPFQGGSIMPGLSDCSE